MWQLGKFDGLLASVNLCRDAKGVLVLFLRSLLSSEQSRLRSGRMAITATSTGISIIATTTTIPYLSELRTRRSQGFSSGTPEGRRPPPASHIAWVHACSLAQAQRVGFVFIISAIFV